VGKGLAEKPVVAKAIVEHRFNARDEFFEGRGCLG
jgi:hypothetical protein